LKKDVPQTLSKKTIRAAVKSEEEHRSKYVVIYGLKEMRDEVLPDRVQSVLQEIDEKPLVKDCVRVGEKRTENERPRPVKFSLRTADHVAQVLRSAKKLHRKEGYKSVYICLDRTAQERKQFNILS
jgi:hypothetical protein